MAALAVYSFLRAEPDARLRSVNRQDYNFAEDASHLFPYRVTVNNSMLDLVRRAGRNVVWAHPSLYRQIGRVFRKHYSDCASTAYDFWVGGFPRSSNTYTAKMLQLCLNQQSLPHHLHCPAPIIFMLKNEKPGIFVIRDPADACISWSQFIGKDLVFCLDYYIDFHRVMAPYAKRLFTAPFALTTSDFGRVIDNFNRRFGSSLRLPEQFEHRIVEMIEANWKNPDGSIREMQVPRPSALRESQRENYLRELNASRRLRKKLARARSLFEVFIAQAPLAQGRSHNES